MHGEGEGRIQGGATARGRHQEPDRCPGVLMVEQVPGYQRTVARPRAYPRGDTQEVTVRVAVLASIAHSVPPRSYGPWEQVASTIAEGLVARGHDVTLFATADSTTSARLHAEAPAGYEEDASVDAKVYEALHIAAVFERAAQFDVISNQFDFLPLVFSRLTPTPVVTTIHHGIQVDDFTLGAGDGGYLLFLGRIHPDKGTATAIEAARLAGLPLVIAGVVQDEVYYRREVAPHVDGRQVRYLGPVGPAERDQLLGGALALLHLIDFDEPFGLSVAESMTTGTPVIAYRRGSMPEIIRPGVSGFLVDDVTQAAASVAAAAQLDRAACRADAVARFSADRMVDDYERLFRRVIEASTRVRRAEQ